MDLSKVCWRKSSFSGNNGGNCIEVAELTNAVDEAGQVEVIAVRDSKNPEGPKLFFAPAEWAAFLDSLKKD